jgi:hypothetical protein
MDSKTEQKWIQGVPEQDGAYWLYNGEERLLVFIQNSTIYRSEKNGSSGYAIAKLPNDVRMTWWYIPCEPPDPPEIE